MAWADAVASNFRASLSAKNHVCSIRVPGCSCVYLCGACIDFLELGLKLVLNFSLEVRIDAAAAQCA